MAEAALPDTVDDVQTPCFLVNIDKVKSNAQAMVDRCKDLGLKLRPHMKTHKSLEIGKIATAGHSKRSIVVSTLKEAEFFADGGFDDIVYGALVTRDKIPRLSRLASRLEIFHVIVDSETGVLLLEDNPVIGKKWSVLIKVDCGSSRAGILWDDDRGVELARQISLSPSCSFHGVYCHEGHSYKAKGFDAIEEVGSQSAERILDLAARIRSAGIECQSIGLGATPTASRPNGVMKDLTELHPGNYLFYDVQQSMIGSCHLDDVAVRVATRVIGHYPHRNQMLIDTGFTALSFDGQGAIPNGSYCLIEGEPNLRLVKMTQEVGIIEPCRGELNFENFPVGKLLFLIPYHSCATACMHSYYIIHQGKKIIDAWTPCRGW